MMCEWKAPVCLYDENYIFQNALEDICMDCKKNQDGLYECYHDHKDDCPAREQIEKIEIICKNLLELINETAAQSKNFKEYDDFDADAYFADLEYKASKERAVSF